MENKATILTPPARRIVTSAEARKMRAAGVPYLWVRRPRIAETRDPVRVLMGMGGEFRCRVLRPDGRCRHDTGWFPNLITNLGLNNPGASSGQYTSISVGTGNTAPAFTDTNLVARVATTSTDNGSSYTSNNGTPGDPAWYTSFLLSLRFSQGAAEGNLAEIGVTTSGSPFNCYSRALILDADGDPTTITVLSDEFLDVSYNHRWYAGTLDDVADTITITGSGDHDIVLRPAELDGGGSNLWRPEFMWQAGAPPDTTTDAIAYNGSLGAVTASPSGTGSTNTSAANSSYVSDTFERAWSASWNLGAGNVAGGISAVRFSCGSGRVPPGSGGSAGAAFQFSLDPVINKTSSQLLTLNFLHSWARRTL